MQTKAIEKEVEFKLGDLPGNAVRQILDNMSGDLELTGTILAFVKLGTPPRVYAKMHVEGIASPMLVPIEALQP